MTKWKCEWLKSNPGTPAASLLSGGLQGRMFTPPSFPINCECCADALPVSRLTWVERVTPTETGAYLCVGCKEDHDKKVAAERAAHFRALSNEWFTEFSPLALERKSCGYEDKSGNLGDY